MERDVFNIIQGISGCSRDELNEARRLNIEKSMSESQALLEAKCGTKEQILQAMSKCYMLPSLRELNNINFKNINIGLIGADNIMAFKFIPYMANGSLKVLVVDPKLVVNIEDLIKLNYPDINYKFIIIFGSDFDNWVKQVGIDEDSTRLNSMLSDISITEVDQEEDVADQETLDQTSIVNIVNRFIIDAVQKGASDIHIEPLEKSLRVRFRIDGLLATQAEIDKRIHKQLVNRIKVMSNLNTTITMTPQSGKLHIVYKTKPIDARVSTIPGIYGEKVTLRIINNDNTKISLEELGFSPDLCKRIRNLTKMANGIILVTGPTGSGKSSTLAAIMSELNTVDKCIISIEDPVEFRIDGITQINVNNAMNLTFSSVLRESLRQDPDIIMVGEIRDAETARIALSASNTGHLVLSTLHTNSASSSAVRLTEMGIETFMPASTLRGIINQKLVRVLCPHCKEKYKLSDESKYMKIIRSKYKKSNDEEINLYKSVGCSRCNGLGYSGRTAIIELLEVNKRISKLILDGASSEEIETQALKDGMVKAIDNGIELVLSGITSLDEIDRVINLGI